MRFVSVDVETHWIKAGMLAPKAVVWSWYDGEHKGLLLPAQFNIRLRNWLLDPLTAVGGHGVFFDLGVACADDPSLLPLVFKALDEGRIWDTLTRQQLIDIARGELQSVDEEGKGQGKKVFRRRDDDHVYPADLSLQALVLWWFDEAIEKDGTWRLHYNELDGVPIEEWPEEARRYVGDDSILAWRVRAAQDAYIIARDFWLPEGILFNQLEQHQAAWALHLMSTWGIRTDAEATAKLKAHLVENHTAALAKLKGTGIYVPKKKREPNGVQKKSMKAIYDRLLAAFAAKGVPCPMTPGGADKELPDGTVRKGRAPVPQTSEEVYLLSGDPDLAVLAESMGDSKLLSTYVPVLERGTRCPVCARYNVLVETGRTSCKHPNMQNPPRKGGVRECFVPRLGNVFCSVDFDTAELRSLAQSCLILVGYSKLAEAFQRGEDPHLLLAAQLLKISPEECKRLYALGDKVVDETRQFAKIGNFGFMGGLGAEAFVSYAAGYGVFITIKEAHRIRDAWFATWTEMRKYFDKITGMTGAIDASIMQMRVGGEPGARVRLPHRRRGGVYFTSCANGFPQGLTADGAKAALYAVTKACYLAEPGDVLYGVRPVFFLHDEIGSEIPYDEVQPERASAAAYEIARIMQIEMQAWVLDVPIKCGPTLFRRWYKGAKAVYVERQGEKVLVPARPLTVVTGTDAEGKEIRATKWEWDTFAAEERIAA